MKTMKMFPENKNVSLRAQYMEFAIKEKDIFLFRIRNTKLQWK